MMLLCASYSSIAQSGINKFNLNFDKYNEETKNVEGWAKWGFYEFSKVVKLDNENYVGKVVSDKGGDFGCVIYKIPSFYKGDSIQLSGKIKTEKVKKGYAGLIMRIDGLNQMIQLENSHKKGIEGTTDWQEYSISLPFMNNAKNIFVGGILQGKGTAWFDDFKVTIDGQDIQVMDEIEQFQQLENVEPELVTIFDNYKMNLTFEDDFSQGASLIPLINIVENKRIVSIGEDTHGTAEFYKFRAALTKALIKNKGFKTIILESPFDDIEVLSKNLKSTPMNELIHSYLLSIYHTQEMKEFLDWLKFEGIAMGVKFKGCDDSYWLIHDLIGSELALQSDIEIARRSKEYLSIVEKYYGENDRNRFKIGSGVYQSLLSIDKYLNENGLQTARLNELIHNAKNSFLNYWLIENGKPIKSRDEIMAERITFLAENNNEKIIVWAHNAHISNDVIIDNEIGLMGNQLKEKFGKDYYSIGLCSLEGGYTYIENNFIYDDHDYSDKLLKEVITFQPDTSWEQVFNKISASPFFIESFDIKKELPGQEVFGKLKLLGYTKETKNDYYDASLLSMFDAVVFIPHTSATTPLLED